MTLNYDAAVAGARALLESCVPMLDDETRCETPARMVRALSEMTSGYHQDPRTFLTVFDDPCDELVMVRNVRFASMCEHHLLPFTGTATVGYIPSGKVVGLSKLPRIVDVYARRLQLQERMTRQIAETIVELIAPLGVGVVVTGEHQCMTCRGVMKPGASMVTSTFLGALRTDAAARAEFLSLASM